ncbi:unnamed protein product [Arctogadus glacialis]
MSRKKALKGAKGESKSPKASPCKDGVGKSGKCAVAASGGAVHPSAPSISTSGGFYDVAFKLNDSVRFFPSRSGDARVFLTLLCTIPPVKPDPKSQLHTMNHSVPPLSPECRSTGFLQKRSTETVSDDIMKSRDVMLVGDSGVGKTCLLVRFKDGAFLAGSFISTVGIDFRNKVMNIDTIKVKLQIWDTAGQERFRSVTHAYYRDAHALLLLYDVTNKGSFDNIRVRT